MTNEDTLLISSGGTFECRVVDPNSACPYDTTWYAITYNCSAVGMTEKNSDLSWSVFPNPASESIMIQFNSYIRQEQIQVYNTMGRVVKVMEGRGTMTLGIADLPNGIYFIRLKDNKQSPLKFIKQ
jgi:hypothetical protein